VGTLYVLDEPSIGLHQRDNRRLIDTLTRLRDLGNTVIVVEHDEETIRESDWIVDIGPGAGEHGGEVVYSGPVPGLLKVKESITGQYLSGARSIPVPSSRRPPRGSICGSSVRANTILTISPWTFRWAALWRSPGFRAQVSPH
jgi:excinuclease ABC subunit A